VAHGSAERREHVSIQGHITKAKAAGAVVRQQGEVLVERARVFIEDFLDAHGGKLPGLLREECLEQREPVVACFGPAIFEGAHVAQAPLLAIDGLPEPLAELAFVKGVEVVELDRIAAIGSALMGELGGAADAPACRPASCNKRDISVRVKARAASGANSPML
jgi:hypothetical protein